MEACAEKTKQVTFGGDEEGQDLEEVKQAAGFTPKTCWIVHVKEQMGFQMRPDPVLKAYESVTGLQAHPSNTCTKQ